MENGVSGKVRSDSLLAAPVISVPFFAEVSYGDVGKYILPEFMTTTIRRDVARDWADRGFSCDLWVDPPGQCWEDFVHNTDELVLVLDGELEFEINGEISHPKTGEELFIPAGVVHSVRNIGASTARWLYGYR